MPNEMMNEINKMPKVNNLFELFRKSYVIWAFIALISIDLFLHFAFSYLAYSKYAQANRSMVYWTVDDFRKQEKKPEIILIGSSLLMHVLHGGDAEYLKLPQNEVYHHRCSILEDLIQKETGRKIQTFAFALAGQMASDAYAITTTVLTGKSKPKAIIYSIAPRDFMDNTLASPGSTEIFKYMNYLGGAKDVAFEARTNFWEKVEYAFEQMSSLYGHRRYFIYLQNKYAKSLLHLIGYKNLEEVHTPFMIRRLALIDYPEDTGPNERIALPNLVTKFTDNREEYFRRYQPFKEVPYKAQLSYLEKLLSYCQNEGIEMILVNMPLMQDNVKLMPAGCYDLYKSDVTRLAQAYNAKFINMHQNDLMDKSLFCDTAHMSGLGGMKFFKALAPKLNTESQVASAKQSKWQ